MLIKYVSGSLKYLSVFEDVLSVTFDNSYLNHKSNYLKQMGRLINNEDDSKFQQYAGYFSLDQSWEPANQPNNISSKSIC